MTLPTIAQYLAACRADLGYEERYKNLTKFAAQAGHPNGQAWCLTFLVAKAKQTGLHLPSYGAFTPTLAQDFKDAGHYGRTPRVGAFGFVYNHSLGRIAHVFVVEAVKTGGYTIGINGNSNAAGSRTGGMVCRVTRSPQDITFGYPSYASTSAPVYNPYRVPVLTTSRPYIDQKNATDAETNYIQWAVGAKVDGDWGDITQDKVGDFQDHYGLKRDYRVGPQTLSYMKKVHR